MLDLDLASVADVAHSKKRPQDRIELPAVKEKFHGLLTAPTSRTATVRSDERLPHCSVAMTTRSQRAVCGGASARDHRDDGVISNNTSLETELDE